MTNYIPRLIKRVPLSLALTMLIWISHPFVVDHVNLLTSGLSTMTLRGAAALTVAALALAVPAEFFLGTGRFAVVVAVCQLVIAPISQVLARLFETAGLNMWGDDLNAATLLSPVGWIFGTAMVASARMPMLWRRRVQVGIVTLSLTMLLYCGTAADMLAVTAALTGLAVTRPKLRFRISLRETRNVVAIVVAATGFAPVLVALNPYAEGPFSPLTQLLWAPAVGDFEILRLCTDSTVDACESAIDVASVSGVGPWVGNALPFIIQLIVCFGLSRGRRLAWWLAVIAQPMTIALLMFQLREIDEDGVLLYGINLLFVLIPWLFAFCVLVAARRAFFVPSAYAGVVKKFAVIATATCGFWFVGTFVFREDFRSLVTLGDVAREFPHRLIPPVLGLMGDHNVIPTSSAAWFVYEWSGNLFWIPVAWLLYRVLSASPSPAADSAREHARQLLEQGTGDHLSFMALWDNNRYFFGESGSGFVAYRLQGNTALTLGEPVIVSGSAGKIADEFNAYARTQGWRPAWYSVGAQFAEELGSRGFRRMGVAEEAVLPVTHREFKGKKFQSVRTARNQAPKNGIRTVWTTWADLDPLMRAKINALSEEWVSEKALPEMGFTLGGLEELKVAGTRLLLAVDADEHLHGITSWLPVRHGGQLAGYTLDVMRRVDGGFKGTIELLISEALIIAADSGCEWISLSGAPLAGTEGMLARFGDEMEPLYGFRSLAASKRKFQPTELPWFLCYDDELALPTIGTAIAGAYLPEAGMRDYASAVRVWVNTKRDALREGRD